jgi:acylphosphatase
LEVFNFKAIVKGFVHGVGYRYFAYLSAKNIGLTGYVKNRIDGNVFVYAEGEQNDLIIFAEKLRTGPNYAQVEDVDIQWSKGKRQFNTFDIRY